MSHLRRLGSEFKISIPTDDKGMIGRECPQTACEGYFKIQPGTGLVGENLPCHCPYCGHTDDPKQFYTNAQVEYVKSAALHQITDALHKDLKALEFNHKPRGGFGIGVSMKVIGKPAPIRYYREQQLETEVICDHCTLRYSIYGVFGFCPDCGIHNSLQILDKNLQLIAKMLSLAETQESSLAELLVENALEDCVSAFDGFGRETCRVFSSKADDSTKASEIRFQNIVGARDRVQQQFGVDFSASSDAADWARVRRAFEKRHLLAHKMGVVDEDYLEATGDSPSLLRRKVPIAGTEVAELADRLRFIGGELFRLLEGLN